MVNRTPQLRYRRGHLLLAGVGLVGLLSCSTSETDSPEPRAESQSPRFTESPQPMPANGTGASRWSDPSGNWLLWCAGDRRDPGSGTVTIYAPAGADTYFVRLSTASGEARGAAFVHPGQTATLTVPACGGSHDYELTYGAGTTWYGYDFYFGPTAAYGRADKPFTIRPGTAWDVSLTARPGGNLGTSAISFEDMTG